MVSGLLSNVFKINLLTVLEYKLDFLAINLASVLALLVGVFNIEIIFSQVDAMKMWSKEEVLWCLGFFYLSEPSTIRFLSIH